MVQSTLRDSGFDVALNILRRRKWSGLIAFTAALALTAPFSVFLPDIYRGAATVIVESHEAPSSFVKASVPELETRLVTVQQEILSRARLSDLVARLDLYPSMRGHASQDAIAERMRRDIRVELTGTDQSRGRATTIGVKIRYIGLDPKSAAAVPNALASMYVEQNTQMRERQTGQMAQFLKGQLEAAGKDVDGQQARLNKFKELRAGQLPEQVSINLVTLERLNTQLRLNSDAQSKVRERQDRLAGLPTGNAEPIDPLVTLKQRLSDLQVKFTDKHPDVIQTKAQISEMERQRANGSGDVRPLPKGNPLRSGDSELAVLEREERTLRSEISAYEQRIQSAPRLEQELEGLERDYKSAKDTYDSLLARYEEAQLAEKLEQTKQGESFRILDSAVVPTAPAAPNRMRLLLMAVFVAVASGVGMMLLREHLDTSFHTVGELRQFTSLPVLASIPYVATRTSLSQVLRVAASVILVIGLCALLAGFAYRTARENTQLVWMLSAPQL